jgi:type IV secretory pathway ATPase VirB11/archaellum biosynthesis ATPase
MKRRQRRNTPAEPIADFGPRARIERGEVVSVTVADPDSPNRTIRRGRVVWAPDVLLSNGTISDAHHAAATRLHDSYSLGILGARDRLAVYIDRCSVQAGFADAQLAAARDYREAAQAVGQVAMSALSWCVLSYGTVAGWAECKGWSKDRAGGYLLAALDRLAEHYDR